MQTIFRFSVFLFAATLLFLSAWAKSRDVSGEWSLVVDSPEGQREMGLSLSLDSKGDLVGQIKSPEGLFEITGEVVGEEIYFGFVIEVNGQKLEINFEGYFDEAEMEGAVYFGDFGSGDWWASKE